MAFNQLTELAEQIFKVIDEMQSPATCECCKKEGTDHATACCQQPICITCFQNQKIDSYSHQPYRTRWVAGRQLTGTYDFTCPFCKFSKHVLDCDRGGMDWAMHAAADGDDSPLAVKIINPSQDGGWR